MTAAFDVRVVGREEQHLGADSVDEPADVLGGVGRHADLPTRVVARPERQIADAALGASEGVLHDIDALEPRR